MFVPPNQERCFEGLTVETVEEHFDKFIKTYYLEDNKCMSDNTYYQPAESDLKMLLQTLWN